jgi:hypothetical protein
MATAMTNAEIQEMQRRLTVYQSRYDEVLEKWGRRAPAPVLTQSPYNYRREALAFAQTFLPENDQWRKVPAAEIAKLDSTVIGAVESQILDALRAAAHHPASVAMSAAGRPDSMIPGIRYVETRDSNGQMVRSFHGESFVKAFSRPCRRVKSFLFDRSALRG